MAKLVDYIFQRDDWYITDNFGYRYHPITGEYSFHYGTDYGTHLGKWPQYAVEDGYILYRGTGGGYGNYIWVRYPRIGYALLHAHLDSVAVNAGDTVASGSVLGYTGTTGNSTGIHLHLGMQPIGSDEWMDPHAYDYAPPALIVGAAERDAGRDQVVIMIPDLNVRAGAGLGFPSLGYAQLNGAYDYFDTAKADGYMWYRIAENQWVADNGSYLEYAPQPNSSFHMRRQRTHITKFRSMRAKCSIFILATKKFSHTRRTGPPCTASHCIAANNSTSHKKQPPEGGCFFCFMAVR